MMRLVHLSDLHFGRDRAELVAPMIAQVNALAPDLVLISGDFTQRARRDQFAQARDLMSRLEARVLAVPGNHDMPLWNLPARLLAPFARYRAAIADDLCPVFENDDIVVACANTADPLAHQRGLFRPREVARICALFSQAGARKRVLVAHHPLEQPPGSSKAPMKGAESAAARLREVGVDLVLSGHLHRWWIAPLGAVGTRGLQVQAGTGLSNRLRDEENNFNLIELRAQAIRVTRYLTLENGTSFTPEAAQDFPCAP
ncbi:phosphodiesterase YaeI [Aquimixticola soesokkakensis]|uniref:Phosphodiesterase YaeI n=1 Tax=Aquimixticola soesokkakensis TaxID=1519096 RepID=A0A1Y5TFP4_9RHOB|nr:metallophosphoesterase family protein [Aquimixticola soesokkakensis]SLN60798.1 phosphodiesterase YaeI [Aquimixticola soesokkakensis]